MARTDPTVELVAATPDRRTLGLLVAVPLTRVPSRARKLLLATGRRLPEHHGSGVGRLDPLSVGLSLAALLPAVYGVKELAYGATGGAALGAVSAVAVGLTAGVVFVTPAP